MHRYQWQLASRTLQAMVVSLLALAATTALAAEPRMLGLEQLTQMALAKSPELKRADQDIAIAMSDFEQAKAAQWAHLDVTIVGGIVNDAKRPVVVVSPRPGPDGQLRGVIEKNDAADGLGPFGKLEFTIVQPLYTFGKIAHRKDAALEAVAAQRAAKERTRGGVILKVKELYFALLLAQQGKDAATDIESFTGDMRTRLKSLLTLGSTNVDESDLYRLESYAAETKRFRAKAESGTNLAYFTLKQFIGLPTGQEFRLDAKELPTDTRALGDQEAYIAQAMRSRPEFEQLERGIHARQNLLEAAKADLYPSFFATAVGSVARAPERQHLNEAYIPDDFNHTRAGVVLGTKWQFDLGLLQGRLDKARAEHQRMLHTKELAVLNIPIEVVKHYQDALEHQAAFQALDKATGVARKWIVASMSSFDIGTGQARDVFAAIERYGRNRGDYLSSLLHYHLALANLSYAVGEYRVTAE